MAKTQVHVWHTPEGKIVAIGRPEKNSKCVVVPVSGHGHSIFSTEVDHRELQSMHRTHAVDLEKKKLVKHAGAGRRR